MEDITAFRSNLYSIISSIRTHSSQYTNMIKIENEKIKEAAKDLKYLRDNEQFTIFNHNQLEITLKKLDDLHSASNHIIENQLIEKLNKTLTHIQSIISINNISGKISDLMNDISMNLRYISEIYIAIKNSGYENSDINNIARISTVLYTSINQVNEYIDIITDNIKNLHKEILNQVYDLKDNNHFLINNIKNQHEETLNSFKTSSTKILANHAHETKKLKNEYSIIENEFKLLKESFQQLQKHNEEIQLKLRHYETSINTIMDENNENIETKMNERLYLIEETYAGKINEIDQTYDKALKNYESFTTLVTRAGIYELTQNYKTKSDDESNEYKLFRKYTSWSIIAAIASTLIIFIVAFVEHYYSTAKQDTNYILLASRLSISVMFFVLAFYLSKQASKHYECYQDNHRTFLQLAALEPFMANMTPEEQKEIRKGLIPSYFNQGSDSKFAVKGDEVGIPTSIGERLDKGFEAIKEILASKKDPQN